MAVQVLVEHRAETQMTDVYIYDTDTNPPSRRVMHADGSWEEIGRAGVIAQPSFSVPDDVLTRVVGALGVPMSDAHLLDALRHERGRVDHMVDALLVGAMSRG